MPEIENNLREAIAGFANGPLRRSSVRMLSALGYQSDRTDLGINSTAEFLNFCSKNSPKKQTNLLREYCSTAKFVFQLTADELLRENSFRSQTGLDKGHIRSFLFWAVDLKQKDCPRGRMAEMTRIVNSAFAMPVIMLYRHDKAQDGKVITSAVVHRRPHRRDESRDVLEKVTLIKDIKVNNPHSAHIQILSKLSLRSLTDVRDFDDLHKRWECVLDTEPLNRDFYQKLFKWFERAVSEGTWPPGVEPEQQVIRCVTRILFIWFIREKGLIAKDWFDQKEMEKLLHNFGGSDYYQAVLQNLFFATLNVPLEGRSWNMASKPDLSHVSHWRYKHLIQQVGHFERLMAKTPFVNGGLFDCLDYEKPEGGDGKKLDMFGEQYSIDRIAAGQNSSTEYLNVPDDLFFDEDGLFPLLKQYKFTVEENTPTEVEVALDPELLGQVFENLLAAYNPETRDTVRKETGSYYTPRAVVNYMVDESLTTALSAKVKPENEDLAFWQKRLRCLFDYENTEGQFSEGEKSKIVHAISNLKILDPAVGSGAFPMAILHKLTLALRHLDPDNSLWQKLQEDAAIMRSQKAYKAPSQSQREQELLDISKIFEHYSGDFGRKLYLIQNSIYGVDIQAIACQIAKLRFFISLTIEQEPNQELDNFGIRALPNLETRFVAADSLLYLKNAKLELSNNERVIKLEKQLLENRERHFHTNTREKKLECRQTDRRLRTKIAEELRLSGFPSEAANRLVHWDPYDQNDVASWFDPKYMFGVQQRFDVVIGNPPYISLGKKSGRLRKKYQHVGYKTLTGRGDIYQLFIERGCRLLCKGGVLAYITSNSWLRADYGKCLREYLTDGFSPQYLVEWGKDMFEADVDTSTLILQNYKSDGSHKSFRGIDIDRTSAKNFPPPKKRWSKIHPNQGEIWRILTDLERDVLNKMRAIGMPLKEWEDVSIKYGIKTGYDKAFVVDGPTKDRLIAEDARSAEILKPIFKGGDIKRYRAKYAGRWLINTHNGYGDIPPIDINGYPAIKQHLDQFYPKLSRRCDKGHTPYNLRNCAYHEDFSQEKLFWIALSPEGRFAYFSRSEKFCLNSAYMLTGRPIKFLCAILNSKLIKWFIANSAPTSGMGELQWIKASIEMIPIPRPCQDVGESLAYLVDRILEALKRNDMANTTEWENQVDRMIYHLYNLKAAEIDTIEKF